MLVVDDEPLARSRILRLLRRRGDAEVVGACGDAAAAVDAIRRERPDILFLDVQLPDRDGFAVIEDAGVGVVPAVVFVTAHDTFALRAFEAHAIDYLLKPFDAARFDRAYDRARTLLGGAGVQLGALLEHVHPPGADVATGWLARLVVPVAGGERIVPVDAIEWLEAASNYVEVHHAGGVDLIRETLAALEARLDPQRFARIHRRVVVRLDRVDRLETLASGDGVVVLRGGQRLRVSRRYRAGFRTLLARGDATPPRR